MNGKTEGWMDKWKNRLKDNEFMDKVCIVYFLYYTHSLTIDLFYDVFWCCVACVLTAVLACAAAWPGHHWK